MKKGLKVSKPSATDPLRSGKQSNVSLPTQPNATITPDRLQMSIRLRFDPIRNLTPDRLSKFLDSFRLGFFRDAALAWDAIQRRDSRLQTVAPKRKKSVARHGWEVLTIDDTPDSKAQKEFLEWFYNHLTVVTALEPDEEGGLSLLIRQMMDAVGMRYAVHEIVWQPQADGTLTAQLIFCPLWWFEGTRGKLRFLTSEFDVYGNDMEAGGWMVTVADGIMEACSVAYMFKHLPLRDWLSFSEKFGTPGLLGKTDAGIGSPEWLAMETALRNFASDWAAVMNQGNTIELIEAKNGNNQPFQPLVSLMDEEMTRLWRGGDLGTSSKHNSNGASLQADETSILEVDDAMLITETLARKLSKYALQWKFGDAPQLAYIKIKVSEPDSTALDLQIDAFLLAAGYPISIQSAAERYSRPIPDDKAELLKAPAKPIADDEEDPNEAEEDDDEPTIANEAATKLINAARDQLAAAVQDDMSHVLSRLASILKIDDDELFLKKLQAFTDDFPAFKTDLLRDPAAARALQPILSSALVNGLATKGKVALANGDLPGHEFHGNQYAGGGSVDDVISGKHEEAAYATVNPAVAAKIKAATGQDVTGYKHFIDRDALIHIGKGHAPGRETSPNQVPVTKDDIQKIPQIVANPDTVEKGTTSRRGFQTIKYGKRFNGTTIYVEEQHDKEKLLMAKTMWKEKTK